MPIDTTTGVATTIGPTGLGGVGGLAIDSTGTIYGSNNSAEIATIDAFRAWTASEAFCRSRPRPETALQELRRSAVAARPRAVPMRVHRDGALGP